MADFRHLEVRLSGGASNTNKNLSLGGVMSTDAGGLVSSQGFSWTPMAGLTIRSGSGNVVGAGTLSFTLTGTLLRWRPLNGSYGPSVNVNTDGTYILFDSTLLQHIVVVKSGALPGANTETTVTVSNTLNAVFDDVSLIDAQVGMTDYRCIFVRNIHGTESMGTLRIWLDQDPVGVSTMTLGADPSGVGASANTIANENTAPAGVTFSVPTQVAPITLGTIPANSFAAFWIRRNVSAGGGSGTGTSLALIGVTFL